MKKIKYLCFMLILFTSKVFARELSGEDLKAVNKILDSKLYVSDYKTPEEKLAYLNKIEKSLASSISPEAALICKNSLIMAKESAKIPEVDLSSLNFEMPKKKEKVDENAKKLALDIFESYKTFAAANEDLSSHFWFHYKEAELQTLPYLSKTQQLKMMTSILDDYKKIEEINPNLSENLMMYGTILYMVPGALGGSKKNGIAKLRKAVDTAACDYEKASACMILAQLLIEEKKNDEALTFINKVIQMSPNNKMMLLIKDMNEKGYSIFQAKKYIKKYGPKE